MCKLVVHLSEGQHQYMLKYIFCVMPFENISILTTRLTNRIRISNPRSDLFVLFQYDIYRDK